MERFKVLGALLVLREFCVRDVAEYCQVKEATVRTVLERNRSLLERVGERETGRRGGKHSIYRVLAERRDELRAMIAALYRELPPDPARGEFQPPLTLLAAEEALRS